MCIIFYNAALLNSTPWERSLIKMLLFLLSEFVETDTTNESLWFQTKVTKTYNKPLNTQRRVWHMLY